MSRKPDRPQRKHPPAAPANDSANNIVAAIEAFQTAWRLKNDADVNDERWERKLRYIEVGGLWAAALVGLIAIVVSSLDSSHQKEVMQAQLAEMRAQQRPNLWVESNLGSPEYVGPSGQVIWTIHLTNYGKNFAVGGTVHKFIRLGSADFTPSYGEPHEEALSPVAPGQDIMYTVVSSPGRSDEEFKSFLATTGGIQVRLMAHYKDLAGGIYTSSICLSRTNAGSITFCPKGNDME